MNRVASFSKATAIVNKNDGYLQCSINEQHLITDRNTGNENGKRSISQTDIAAALGENILVDPVQQVKKTCIFFYKFRY